MWFVMMFILSKQPAMSNTAWGILCQSLWKLFLQYIKAKFPTCHIVPVLQSYGHWDKFTAREVNKVFLCSKIKQIILPSHLLVVLGSQFNGSSNKSIAVETNYCCKSPSRLTVLFYSILYSHSRLTNILFPNFNPWTGV